PPRHWQSQPYWFFCPFLTTRRAVDGVGTGRPHPGDGMSGLYLQQQSEGGLYVVRLLSRIPFGLFLEEEETLHGGQLRGCCCSLPFLSGDSIGGSRVRAGIHEQPNNPRRTVAAVDIF
ncbi:unnamed protein product, partial [Ectocarpus sp. 13 AM-2016]